MADTRTLVVATRNPKKRSELLALLEDLECTVLSLDAFANCPEVEESGATFEENAVLKATVVARETGYLTLADDSGLMVDALGGAPGVRSARFAVAAPGQSQDEANNAKLLSLLAEVPDVQRTARFVCTIAIADPGRCLTLVRGEVEGRILRAPQGKAGFGYDPLFLYEPFAATFAEIDAARKGQVSHRGHALRKAKAWLADWWERRELSREG